MRREEGIVVRVVDGAAVAVLVVVGVLSVWRRRCRDGNCWAIIIWGVVRRFVGVQMYVEM